MTKAPMRQPPIGLDAYFGFYTVVYWHMHHGHAEDKTPRAPQLNDVATSCMKSDCKADTSAINLLRLFQEVREEKTAELTSKSIIIANIQKDSYMHNMEPLKQNHHHIPRFILRKFAPEDQPPAAPAILPGKGVGKKDKKMNRKKGPRPDFLVNKVDLDKSILTQRPVSTEFSLVDMYRDPGFDDNPYHLEEKLSKLERSASNILKKAVEKFAEKSILDLKRIEVDILRKFLFLMKYRNTSTFHRYNHDYVDKYDADDRERMLKYMESKGFTKPRDVWFDNLRHLLDLKMDVAKSWIATLKTQMYPDDAAMFVLHLTSTFMAFCKPESPEDEYLLTENAYGIFEGPSTIRKNTLNGKEEPIVYIEYHNFAPVSPRLMIILRSHLLSPRSQENAGLLAEAIRFCHLDPDRAGSMLQELPISPCDHGYVHSAIDSTSSFHKEDKFYFRCFKLSLTHIATINSLLLEEAHATSSIVYHSRESLKRSIENYLNDETEGLKYILDSPLDKRRLYLTTLEKILRDLGGTARCKIKKFSISSRRIHMTEHVAVEVAIQLLQSEEKETPLPWIYLLMKQGRLAASFNASTRY